MVKKLGIVFLLVALLVPSLGLGSKSVEAADKDWTITDWQHHHTMKSSTVVEKIVVLAGTLIVTNYVLAPYTGLKTLVQFAAGVFTITKGQNLWTTTEVYRKFADLGEGKTFMPVAGEQSRITYYTDSKRTEVAGNKTLTHYTDWYY